MIITVMILIYNSSFIIADYTATAVTGIHVPKRLTQDCIVVYVL